MTHRLADWSAGWWKMIAGAAAVMGASLAAMAAFQITPATGRALWIVAAGLFGGATGSGGVLALYVVLRQYRRIHETEAQLRALINVRPLTGSLPLSLGGWAADPVLADRAVRLLAERRPNLVVECGSGWSTVLMACCLRELGQGKLVALEHLGRFADRTRSLLRHYGVADRAEVVHAPIEDRLIDGEAWRWYGVEPRDVVEGRIDLLVVDGPPGGLARRSRYPAVPVFEGLLAERFAVVLDDGHREDEAWIADRWGRRLGVEPRLDPVGRGIFVFMSSAGTEQHRDPRADGSTA